MKSAEKWWNESHTHWAVQWAAINKSTIKQIQLDAAKSAYLRVAKMLDGSDDENIIELHQKVLAKAESLTVEDL